MTVNTFDKQNCFFIFTKSQRSFHGGSGLNKNNICEIFDALEHENIETAADVSEKLIRRKWSG